MTDAQRSAVDLAPAKLHADGRSGDVECGDRAATDCFADEGAGVAADYLPGANGATAGAQDVERHRQAKRTKRRRVGRRSDVNVVCRTGVQGNDASGDRRRHCRSSNRIDIRQQVSDRAVNTDLIESQVCGASHEGDDRAIDSDGVGGCEIRCDGIRCRAAGKQCRDADRRRSLIVLRRARRA